MTKEELLAKLKKIKNRQKGLHDTEGDHLDADQYLMEFINDDDISKAYAVIDKWYA